MSQKTFTPSDHPLKGSFLLPGDKSISHRAFLLSFACRQPVSIKNINEGKDVKATQKALKALGANITEQDGVIFVNPCHTLKEPSTFLDMANSGTTARLLMGILSSLPLTCELIGDPSLSKRPMHRVADPLIQMGAHISLTSSCLPARIEGRQLQSIYYEMPVASAQVKSALLLAGVVSCCEVKIKEPIPLRDHTENLLKLFGYHVVKKEGVITFTPSMGSNDKEKRLISLDIPGDPSSAAFLCVASLLIPDSYIKISSLNGNILRTEYLHVLKQMNACIDILHKGEACGEPLIDISSCYSSLKAIETLPHQSAALIDEFPILSVAAAFAEGVTIFKGVSELKVKESNRLSKTLELLNLCGFKAWCEDDNLYIKGCGGHYSSQSLSDAITFDADLDHRMAMSAIILARCCHKTLHLKGSDTIATSYPTFLKDFF